MTSLKSWIKQKNAKAPSTSAPGGETPTSANPAVTAAPVRRESPKLVKRYGMKMVKRAGDLGNAK